MKPDMMISFFLTQAEKLEQSLGVTVLRHSEKKPSGGEALEKHLAVPPTAVAFAGDRILTDVIFGNLNGNLTIWTRQIVTEEGDNKAAVWLRGLENRLVKYLQRLGVKPPPHSALQNKDTFVKEKY
ncbi:hypothetical protein DFQ28_004856 [Apophysomyces sp. BC1034]|nr:hypothetical protein DFQ30_006712 [Apophysomyces sp. BC1015]KAG0193523.1 hypothetical protein DFQ28_004856 [Apophysomyces sp. BC1034]